MITKVSLYWFYFAISLFAAQNWYSLIFFKYCSFIELEGDDVDTYIFKNNQKTKIKRKFKPNFNFQRRPRPPRPRPRGFSPLVPPRVAVTLTETNKRGLSSKRTTWLVYHLLLHLMFLFLLISDPHKFLIQFKMSKYRCLQDPKIFHPLLGTFLVFYQLLEIWVTIWSQLFCVSTWGALLSVVPRRWFFWKLDMLSIALTCINPSSFPSSSPSMASSSSISSF